MQAFIFDFDGVIVDSERHWLRADTDFFPSLVPGYDALDAKHMMGLGIESGYHYLVGRHGAFLPFEEYKRRVDAEVDDIYSSRAKLLPGIPALLDRLDALGTPVGIASSSRNIWVGQALKRLGIHRRFQAIKTGDDVGVRTKPLPDVYLLCAESLGLPATRCTALEDSDNGIKAAKTAGMTCVAIRTDMNEAQSLAEADLRIGHMDELDDAALRTL